MKLPLFDSISKHFIHLFTINFDWQGFYASMKAFLYSNECRPHGTCVSINVPYMEGGSKDASPFGMM